MNSNGISIQNTGRNILKNRIAILLFSGLSIFAASSRGDSWTSGTGYMWLNPTTSRIGIGMSTLPADKLQISGGGILIDNNRYIRAKNTSGTATNIMGLTSGNGLNLYGGKLFISSSGNVGIGTQSPAFKLDVKGNTYLDGNIDLGNYNTNTSNIGIHGYMVQQGGSAWFQSTLDVSSDLTVSGNLSVWGTKNFVQAHPKDEGKVIVYVASDAYFG